MIPQSRYIQITSGVGGGAGVRLRDLISRLFTNNELVPPGGVVEFTDETAVGAYFGTTGEEYKRAVFYFGFIGKTIARPKRLAFGRWCDTAVAPKVWGNKVAKTVNAFSAIANGGLNITMGADAHDLAGINLTGAATLAAVATAIQTALRAAAGTQWAACSVTFDATTNRFNLAGGVPGAGAMAVGVASAGTDLAPLLGWTAASGAIINNGSAVETLSASLDASAQASNNFGSFLFMPSLQLAQKTEIAGWNDAQNNMFLYMGRTDAANAATLSAAILGMSGAALTLSPLAGEYPEMLPGMILAATDYTQRGAAQNYMFQQAQLTPAVATSAEADTYDNMRVNYYGVTQTAGQQIAFYQRGVLMGTVTDATDMNTYANEMWLKDAASVALMSLLLSQGQVPANAAGRLAILGVLAGPDVVGRALDNGTISVGKDLSTQQKLFVSEQTGDPLAWVQVQSKGYWLDVVMVSYATTDGRVEWKAQYKLVYSKADAVRKVEGTHDLI